MELVLTGRMCSARRIVEEVEVDGIAAAAVREAVTLVGEIATKSQVTVQAQKEAANAGTFRWLLIFLLWISDDDSHSSVLAGCFLPFDQGSSGPED
jgi:hypothetical protein